MSLLSAVRDWWNGVEYCQSCGSLMHWVRYGSGFSRYSGAAVIKEMWACSNNPSHWEYKRRYREVLA